MEKNTVKATVLTGIVTSAATAGVIALADKKNRQHLVKAASSVVKKTTAMFVEGSEQTKKAGKKVTKKSRVLRETAQRQLHMLKQGQSAERRVN